jgi:hypothetical protein
VNRKVLLIALADGVSLSDGPRGAVGDIVGLCVSDSIILSEILHGVEVALSFFNSLILLITASTIRLLNIDSVKVAEAAVMTAYFHSALNISRQAVPVGGRLNPNFNFGLPFAKEFFREKVI